MAMKTKLAAAAAAVLLLLGAAPAALGAGHEFPDCVNGPLASNKVCDTTASVTDRAAALIAALETEEKFNLVINTSPGVPRLGLPSYEWWQEALHGVAGSPGVNFNQDKTGEFWSATSFPQPILMGAAFDDALIQAVATVISTEARAFNNANRSGLDYWTPNINPLRDSRWGRGQETPGEDPFHIKSYVKALIRGLQGQTGDPYLKIAATCKHFAGYDLENWGGYERYDFDAVISPQELNEYYMQPFQACTRDARVASIMCSYNALNGVPTCADTYILDDLLRKHWNWTEPGFYVTSDCDSIQNIFQPHQYKDTREGAAAAALTAGTDLNCGTYYSMHLPGAYQQGLINDTTIDNALIRLYSAQIRLGMFDPPDNQPYRALKWADVNTESSQALALKAAEEGIVLLKNNGLLPLHIPSDKTTTIAMIGGWANATGAMQGNYAGTAPFLRSPLMAIDELPGVQTTYYGGLPGPTTGSWPNMFKAAAQADIIIFADATYSGESNDRDTIRWDPEHKDAMDELAAMGKPFILLHMGDQLDDSIWLSHPNVSAVIWGGFPGQSGGDALVNILTGKTAPAGRMPVTQYPENYVFEVPMTDMSLRPNASSGNPGRTYMWYDQAVVEFGFGLHYTTFTAAVDPQYATSGGGGGASSSTFDIATLTQGCDDEYKDLCPFQTVPVTVSNTGSSVTSDFVTLGFMAGAHGPEPYPRKQLVAYQRLFAIAPGSSATAQLNLTLASLGRHDEHGNLVVYPGEYSLLIDVPTQATWNFTLTGDQLVLEEWPQQM